MMAGNPNWWSMDTSSTISDIHHHQEVTPNFLISQTHPNNNNNNNNNSVFPVQYLHGSLTHHSWSQLLLGGLGNDHQEEEIFGPSLFQSTRVMSSSVVDDHDHVKQEVYGYNHSFNHDDHDHDHDHDDEEQETRLTAWSQSHTTMPTSSPKSCVTTLSSPNNILDFSATKRSLHEHDTHLHLENSNYECNSTPTKKPRVQSSSNPPLKVRKEKLGDRITALHQLVSPFGKTDTASVLLEAIGYIRILQVEIQALSTPYLGSNSGSAKHLQSVQGERSYLFPDHPGQLLNDSCLKRREAAKQQEEKQDVARELKSRGLCLVPISCTQLVGSDNGADYWAPSLGGGF